MKLRQLSILLAVAGMLLCSTFGALAQEEPEEKASVMGWQMMSEQERDQYRTAMRALETEQERTAMRAKHQKEMRSRAKEQGIELAEPRGGPRGRGAGAGGEGRGRGRDLMTPEEKAQRREENRSKVSPEERERARNEHRQRMRERAGKRGFDVPDEPMGRGGAGRGQGQGPREGQGQSQGPGRGGTR